MPDGESSLDPTLSVPLTLLGPASSLDDTVMGSAFSVWGDVGDVALATDFLGDFFGATFFAAGAMLVYIKYFSLNPRYSNAVAFHVVKIIGSH